MGVAATQAVLFRLIDRCKYVPDQPRLMSASHDLLVYFCPRSPVYFEEARRSFGMRRLGSPYFSETLRLHGDK